MKILNFKSVWKILWSKGPCIHCGRNTRSMNFKGEFIHMACDLIRMEKNIAKRKQEEMDRHHVNLMKQALREIELEKSQVPNDLSRHASRDT
jgi:hypothetical protein